MDKQEESEDSVSPTAAEKVAGYIDDIVEEVKGIVRPLQQKNDSGYLCDDSGRGLFLMAIFKRVIDELANEQMGDPFDFGASENDEEMIKESKKKSDDLQDLTIEANTFFTGENKRHGYDKEEVDI